MRVYKEIEVDVDIEFEDVLGYVEGCYSTSELNQIKEAAEDNLKIPHETTFKETYCKTNNEIELESILASIWDNRVCLTEANIEILRHFSKKGLY
jgi:hypothetical protein